MDNRFITAFITPSKWDIVGYSLKPYSVRKLINLAAIESPYITGQVPSPLETIQFLKWCSSDCDSIIEVKTTDWFDKIAYAKIRFQPHFHVHVIKCIINYIKEYTTGPNYRIPRKDNVKKTDVIEDKNSMPELLILTSMCMAKFGMSEKEAFDCSIGKLAWYGAVLALLEGADVKLMSDEEMDSDDAESIKQWEIKKADELRLAMANGKVPKKKIKLRSDNV